MSEIREDDKVVRTDLAMSKEWTVEAIRGESAWISCAGHLDRVVPLSDLVKVDPKFEVGKMYRPVEEKSRDFIIKIESVNDRWAIGWLKDGEPWHLEQSLRNLWMEWTDKQAAIAEMLDEPAEVAAEEVRRVVRVTISTRHPENYILHDTSDRSQWKIAPGGTWVLHKPPYLMF